MALAVSRRPLNMEVQVCKVALGQVFLRILRLSLVNIVPPWLSRLIIWGMNYRPVGGRSSDTVSPHRHEQQQYCIILEKLILKSKFI
jgi:hypothetical protein